MLFVVVLVDDDDHFFVVVVVVVVCCFVVVVVVFLFCLFFNPFLFFFFFIKGVGQALHCLRFHVRGGSISVFSLKRLLIALKTSRWWAFMKAS